MAVWNVNFGSSLVSSKAQSIYMSDSAQNNFAANNAAGFSSEYAKILAEKISKVETEMQKAQDSLARQQQNSGEQTPTEIETVKKLMPDGTIRIITYEDGKFASEIKKRPHLLAVPDYSAPPTPSGETATKLEPQLSVMELFML